MGRRGDNAPVGNTCPDINQAQSIADSVIEAIDASIGEFSDAKKYLNNLISQLELLRNENTKLREWGNEYYNRCEDFQEELEDKESEKDRYKEEADDLKRECRDFQNEIADLNDEIRNLKELRENIYQ